MMATNVWIERLPATCTLYADRELELPATNARVRRLPLSDLGSKVGRLHVATCALGALLEDSGLFPAEALATAIESFQRPAIAKANLEAVQVGAALVRDGLTPRRDPDSVS